MKIISRLIIITFTTIIVIIYNLAGINTYEEVVNDNLCNDVKLPIIMYHALLKDKNAHGEFVISPEQFEEDIKYIIDNGYEPIHVKQLIEYADGVASLPDKPIMITIDDGYYNNYLYAFPILKKYNVKAVISPIMKYSELYSQHSEDNAYYSHITWQQGKEMVDSGLVEFQNHTYDLHSNTSQRKGIRKNVGENTASYQKMLYADLYKAHHLIKENFGIAPQALTFPFGFYSNEAETVLNELGYKVSFSSEEGINVISPTSSLLSLKRFNRPYGIITKEYFKNILK